MKEKRRTNKNATAVEPTKMSFSGWKSILLMASVVVVIFLSFSPTLENSFINQDDDIYVFNNKDLMKPIPEAIGYFFAPHYFSGNYIPVTMIAYCVGYHAAGITPGFFHGLSLFIHLLNVLLVFWFVYLISRKKMMVAAAVSLFFGIHPMHVESVAWVAELKDMLYTFFFLIGLIVYYNYIEKHGEGSNTAPETSKPTDGSVKKNPLKALIIVFACFCLSFLSKPAAIIFPFVLLLVDFYAHRKMNKGAWVEKMPFLAVAVIFGLIAIKAQQADNLINNDYTLLQRLFFASYGLMDYLVKLFLPLHLSSFYPFPDIINGRLPYIYYAAPLGILVLFYGVYRSLKYTRVIAFGFLFFCINLVLVLQVLPIGNAITADRYSYVPYIGLLFVIAMGLDHLYQKSTKDALKHGLVVVTILSIVACPYLTYQRCKIWENADTVASDVLDKYPNSRIALNNRGYLFLMEHNFDESVPLFEKALQIKPDYVMANINLINASIAMKRYDTALKYADLGLKYSPANHNLLGAKGNALLLKDSFTTAIKYYNEAIPLKRDDIGVYIHLAQCYFALHDLDKSIEITDSAMRYDSLNYFLLNNKGYFLFSQGKYADAIEYYKAALKVKPDFNTATINLNNCYRAMNDTTKAGK